VPTSGVIENSQSISAHFYGPSRVAGSEDSKNILYILYSWQIMPRYKD
jgi:hypothetical protein